MDSRSRRRVLIDDRSPASGAVERPDVAGPNDDVQGLKFRPSDGHVTEDQEPFMGIKVRRKASLHRDYKGDYIDVPSNQFLMKILQKQG